VIGVATLKTHQSICGSAGNRRAWATFHHIINPHTLESPRNILAVWALANSTLEADALTSGLFFTTPQILATEFLYEYAIMYADHSVEYSPHFPGEFF
jgi:thiamine biosynthesis lipoprotein